ncbi:MAG: hypothetical protein KKA22_10020 [Gammaproteobacteria bacterium]|jgi:hypothetical protein|nr:hypothetical protein [Gammaproteobacteria bacterium]MBU1408467.1 hypothetical protein [Gammaproteobacteria bacterium]MBU1532279.1 hypothetical protein [Gammaproteobacteria bacterium]
MSGLEWLEAASYIVTIVGLPLAIGVYVHDRRREQQTDEEEIFLRLSDEYADFMRLVIANADLHLLSPAAKGELGEDQLERKLALFAILVSLFERAYVLVYEDDMSRQQQRLWQSWADYMHEWCQREDFRAALPPLLQGEDPGFVSTIRRIAEAAGTAQ